MSASSGLIVGLATLAALVMGRWLMTGRYRKPGDVTRLALSHAPFTVPVSVGLVLVVCWWLPPAVAAVTAVTVVLGVAVSWIDIDVHRIPNRFLLIWAPVQAVSLVGAVWVMQDPWRLLHAVLGAAVFGGVFLVLALVAGMGMGDVKLAAICGAVLGLVGWPGAVLQGMVVAAVLGGLVGLVIRGRQGPGAHMPYGPAIVAGTLAAIAFS